MSFTKPIVLVFSTRAPSVARVVWKRYTQVIPWVRFFFDTVPLAKSIPPLGSGNCHWHLSSHWLPASGEMRIDLRETEAPRFAGSTDRVGGEFTGSRHLQYTARLEIKKSSNDVFIDEWFIISEF
jgi:hypothetical protein